MEWPFFYTGLCCFGAVSIDATMQLLQLEGVSYLYLFKNKFL